MEGSRTRSVRRREVVEGVRVSDRDGGRGGEKWRGEVGVCAQSNELEPPTALAPEFGFAFAPPAEVFELVVCITVPNSGSGASRTAGRIIAIASRMMECRRRSCEDMKGAEWRSPVQRVMSMQSRDWLRSVRRWESVGRGRGLVGWRVRSMCGRVLRRRWIVWGGGGC